MQARLLLFSFLLAGSRCFRRRVSPGRACRLGVRVRPCDHEVLRERKLLPPVLVLLRLAYLAEQRGLERGRELGRAVEQAFRNDQTRASCAPRLQEIWDLVRHWGSAWQWGCFCQQA